MEMGRIIIIDLLRLFVVVAILCNALLMHAQESEYKAEKTQKKEPEKMESEIRVKQQAVQSQSMRDYTPSKPASLEQVPQIRDSQSTVWTPAFKKGSDATKSSKIQVTFVEQPKLSNFLTGISATNVDSLKTDRLGKVDVLSGAIDLTEKENKQVVQIDNELLDIGEKNFLKLAAEDRLKAFLIIKTRVAQLQQGDKTLAKIDDVKKGTMQKRMIKDLKTQVSALSKKMAKSGGLSMFGGSKKSSTEFVISGPKLEVSQDQKKINALQSEIRFRQQNIEIISGKAR